MTDCGDFRDLLGQLTLRCTETWGLSDTVASEDIQEAVMLADEATLFDVAVRRVGKDREEWLPELASGLDSDAIGEAIVSQGQQWGVVSIAETAARALSDIKESLEAQWSPARAGMALRALPVLAGSRCTSLGETLAHLLGVQAVPQDLITAYAEAFCRKDHKVLRDVDAAVTSDPSMGMLATEMASRLLGQLGSEANWMHEPASDRVVSCLALLIRDMMDQSQVEGNN